MLTCCVEFAVLISLVHSRYNDRLRERLQEFAVGMSSLSQIYFHIMNSERRRVKMLPWWRRFWYWKKSKHTMFMEALATMSDLDISKITEEALGHRLPQFNQHSKRSDTSSLNERQDDESEKMQRTSKKTNGIERQGRQFEKKFEMEAAAVDFDNEVITEESSCPPTAASSSEPNVNASHHRQVTSKIGLVARKLSVFSRPKCAESRMTLPSLQPPSVDSSELREVVIGGRSINDAAGVAQMQPQQQRRIAHAVQTELRDAAAASNPSLLPESTPRAAVTRTKTLAALAINPRGTSSSNSYSAVQKPSSREMMMTLKWNIWQLAAVLRHPRQMRRFSRSLARPRTLQH